VVEVFDDIGAEEEACATGGETPSVDVVWIGPQEIAHGAFVGDFLFAVDEADFVDAVD
jgi:hypothetical protein